MRSLADWRLNSEPKRIVLSGNYCRLEPLETHHANDLFEASMGPGCEDRFRFLTIEPQSQSDFRRWLEQSSRSVDPMYFAVIDKLSNRCEGRQSLMRLDSMHGVIELGNILWGAKIARSRVATEAFFLMANYVFESLGFRRLEWKCDALNTPSRNAALRFGFTFEGVFRQHMIVKGVNRDTAWFSILNSEWHEIQRMMKPWLAEENFDSDGKQRARLRDFRIQ